jgi:hypothetical protein
MHKLPYLRPPESNFCIKQVLLMLRYVQASSCLFLCMQCSFASVPSQYSIDLLFARGAHRESIALVCLALAHVRVQPCQRVATFQQIQKELANSVYYS